MDYVLCTRALSKGQFTIEPGAARYLAVPPGATDLLPEHAATTKSWVESVLFDADPGKLSTKLEQHGEVLFFIHGFNTTTAQMLERHRLIRKGLNAAGWRGALIGFDWPSANSTINYLEDRFDAMDTARTLVRGGIQLFTKAMRPNCRVNMHVLAHSMGAFVLREAFGTADYLRSIAQVSWTVGQTILVAGDISQGCLAAGHAMGDGIYVHSTRVTNYSNPWDGALSVSGAKRLGASPRAGRVGLPATAPSKAVNVDTGDYFQAHEKTFAGKGLEFAGHTWYFNDKAFYRDLSLTLQGEIDRNAIPTRAVIDGRLILKG